MYNLPPKLNNYFYITFFLLTSLTFFTPSKALFLGIFFSIILGNPMPKKSANLSKNLLKLSVIGLGFGVDFFKIIEIGKSSLILTFVTICITILIGIGIGQLLKIEKETSLLISFGTSICGGSAIAALSPSINAKNSSVAVSLTTVFVLNAIALFIFPTIGHYFHLSQEEFGLFSALAIHDTSSVVGAASIYGTVALSVATIVKLSRALWIAPFSFGLGLIFGKQSKVSFPYFILGFIAASLINTTLSPLNMLMANTFSMLYAIAKQLLVMSLFLIGSGLTKETLKETGIKPLIFAVILWIFVSTLSFWLIKLHIIFT